MECPNHRCIGPRISCKEYLASAEHASEWIWNHLRDESGRLYARYRDGERAHKGYLDDYAFLVWSFIELYEATFDSIYLDRAIELTTEQIRLFWDEDRGGFFFTGIDQDAALTRLKELYDGAIPSGNSVSAYNLIRLAKSISSPELLELAEAQIEAFAGVVQESPTANPFFLLAMQFAMRPTKEIVIVGEPQAEDTQQKVRLIQQAYLPETILQLQNPKQPIGPEEIQMKPSSHPQESLVYICENYTCHQPITTMEELRKALV